jgi:phosphoglucosamine mutase
MTRKYFGTDGIRGRANTATMAPDFAMRVAAAAASLVRRDGHRPRAVIGKDTRLSGYTIESAMICGFTAAGADVFQLGPTPTPAVALLTRSLRADLGVMISASHNPYADNGIKIFGADGYKLTDALEAEIEARIDAPFHELLVAPDAMGRARRIEGAHERYVEFAKRTLPRVMTFQGIRVALDCANGAAYKVVPQALWELGAEVVSIGVEPNGMNINEKCGSTDPKALCAKVKELRADIGIALDGDADRVIIVDESGSIIDGDQLLALIAKSFQAKGRLSGSEVVSTVMANLGLERCLEGLNLRLHRTPVGDRHVIAAMREKGLNVGGEPSGHIILSDYTTTGDGFLTALQILACVIEQGGRVSEVCNCFEPVPQVLRNVSYRGRQPLGDPRVKKAIESARGELNGAGRLIVRASGTEPVIRIMAEGDNPQIVRRVVDDIAASMTAAN